MKTSKHIFTTIGLFTIFLLGLSSLHAQETKKDNSNDKFNNVSYEIYLQAVIGTDSNIDGKKVSDEVVDLIKNIDKDDSYKNYELFINSYQRVASNGQIQSENVVGEIGRLKAENFSIPISWQLGSINQAVSPANNVSFRRFSFVADVPMKSGSKILPKRITHSIDQINMKLGKSDVIASMPLPVVNETLYFILTVKKVEN